MNIIEIQWIDSNRWGGWESRGYIRDEIKKDGGVALITSVGFLIEETSVSYTICLSYSDSQFGQIVSIPKEVVEKIKVIKNETHFSFGSRRVSGK